jgi:thermostable 8-oxoguanine DNA glycosylase
LGRTLAEEVSACLLGGFGMPAEMGICAFERLREAGLLEGTPSADVLEAELRNPLRIAGTWRSYRFPKQKARYLAAALVSLQHIDIHRDDISLRNCLTEIPGIGLKTASWVVRNYRDSNEVAIIDVHILRLCRAMGLFAMDLTPENDYLELEDLFITFANALGTPASFLDGLMWNYLKLAIPQKTQLNLFNSPNP